MNTVTFSRPLELPPDRMHSPSPAHQWDWSANKTENYNYQNRNGGSVFDHRHRPFGHNSEVNQYNTTSNFQPYRSTSPYQSRSSPYSTYPYRSSSPSWQEPRSRSPYLIEQQQSIGRASPSLLERENYIRSRSPSYLENHIRSASPSYLERQNHIRSTSPSYLERQNHIRSISPSFLERQNHIRSISPSYLERQNHIRSASPSYLEKKNHIRSRSPSFLENRNHLSRSPSNTDLEVQDILDSKERKMPSAGAIFPPSITPLRDEYNGRPVNQIDTETLLELETETPGCKMYFTTDGTRPNPFKRYIGSREVTFKYKAPFTLKPGKRCVRAVSVTKDLLQESAVVTKTFIVDKYPPPMPEKPVDVDDFFETKSNGHDTDGMETLIEDPSDHSWPAIHRKNKIEDILRKSNDYRNPSPPPAQQPKTAWGAPTTGKNDIDGPFNPVNYSGTQINLWGMPPEAITDMAIGPHAFGMKKAPGGFTKPEPQNAVTPAHIGALTSSVMQKMEKTQEETVKDVKKAIKEMEKEKSKKEKPKAIEGPKEPTLMPVSPGNGDFKKQISHIYAQLLEFAKGDSNFRAAIGDPKMGKVLNAEFDEGDSSFLLTVELSMPGKKKAAAPKKVVKKPKEEVVQAAPPPEKPKKSKRPPGKETVEKPPTEHELKPQTDVAFFQTEEYAQAGTVHPVDPFDAEADSAALKKAMKGFGTNEQAIIDILGHRGALQRAEIAKTFKTNYGEDLCAELKSELSGHFEDLCVALCQAPDEFDANQLRGAMKGLGTNEDTLIEIICTRTNAQLKQVIETYKSLFNRDLEKDVMSETSGHFKRILVSCLQCNRDENPEYDLNAVKKDAEALLAAGEKKWGTDESEFNKLLAAKSFPYLRALFKEYETVSGKDINQTIQDEMSGDLRKSMLTIVMCIKDKPRYFAEMLHKSMKGLGTNDDMLCRIIISRCEIDMVQIKESFNELYNATLESWIDGDTSGDYKKMLMCLVGSPGWKK